MRMELHDKGLVFFLQLLLLEKQKKKFEKVVPQLLISNIGSYIDNCIVDHCGKISL